MSRRLRPRKAAMLTPEPNAVANASGKSPAPAYSRLTNVFATDWSRALLIFLIALAVRTPSLTGEFLWDDEFLARDSPFIKSPLLAGEVFRHYLFPDSFSAHYRPVQNLTFMVDYLVWNSNTFGYHLTNLLLHASGAVALYFLLRRLLRLSRKPERENSGYVSVLAFFVSLIWAVHPVHSAAVDYISGRADSLAFFFSATAWCLVLRAKETERPRTRYCLFASAAVLGLLALCSRETACIWLVLFLLHTLFFTTDLSRRRKWIVLAVSAALFLVYVGLRQLPAARSGPGPAQAWSAPTRVVLALRALGDYGRLMVFPANLHMERTVVNGENYGSEESWQHSVAAEYLSILGLCVLALLVAGGHWRGTGQQLRMFGAIWFFLAYLPTSNLIELNATCAEHWLYLPSVGLLIFLAGCILDLPLRLRPVFAGLAALAVVSLSARSVMRSSDWGSSARVFYERTLAAGGESVRVTSNLAEIYARAGQSAKAETMLRRLLKAMPDFPMARNALARILFEQGRKSESEALFAASAKQAGETSKTYPRTWLAALNLAQLLHAAHRDAEALAMLNKARADYPEIWEIVSLESEILRETKGPGAALPLVEDFARRHWWNYGAVLARGRLFAATGSVETAVQSLRMASWLDLHETDGLNLIALLRVRQHRLVDAYRAQKRAVARQPDAPRQYLLLSDILEQMGESDAAHAMIAKVARLKEIGRQPQLFAN